MNGNMSSTHIHGCFNDKSDNQFYQYTHQSFDPNEHIDSCLNGNHHFHEYNHQTMDPNDNITWLPPPFITGSYPSSSRRPRRNSTRRPGGWNNTDDDDGDDWDPIDDDDNGTGSSGRDRNWWWWWNPDRWWDDASGRDRYYDDYDYHYDTPKWRRVWRWVGLGIGVFFIVVAILLMACLICAVAKSKRRRQVDPYADIYGDGRAEPPPVAMGAMPTYPTPPTAKY
ncbi:hypothetical protein AAVH_22518 [Aphelenchoides avenae]|nr:hypothetical protein AAVH_22518 [Aphelenchus avenae]